MEFRYLVSFLAIAEELHFGRAAARLHLAQPSLSQQLQRLEKELGVVLVARTSHEVRLTPAGRAFEKEARHLVEQATKAVETARQAAAGRVGRIDIGFNYVAGRSVLPPILRCLQSEHPGIVTRLWEKRTGPQLQALAEGDLDIAMVYGRPSAPQLKSHQVLRIPMVAVVGEHHQWAGRDHVRVRELAQQQILLWRREVSPHMHDTIVAAAERSGVKLTVADEVDEAAATELVLETRPVVSFASAARRAHAWSRGLVTVPLVDPVPVLELNVVWRADAKPVVRPFLDALEALGPFQQSEESQSEAKSA